MVAIPPEQLEYILNQPAQQSPDGVYHLDNPPNKNAQGLVPAGRCMAIGSSVALLRTYSKLACTKKVRWEDYLGLVGLIAYLGMFIDFVLLSETPGLWVHEWDLRVKQLEPYIKRTYAFVTCYGCAMIFLKAAVLLEWVHIFVPTGRRGWFFWTSHVVLFMNASLYVAGIVSTWMTCTPMEKEYRPWVEGICIDRKKMDETVFVFNLVMNLVILLLPHRIIWRLQTQKKEKLGITLVFSVGAIACVCAAGGVYANFTLDYHNDASYGSPLAELWAIGEGTCILLVFCIPTAPKVFRTDDHLMARIAHSLCRWGSSTRTWPSGSQTSLHQPNAKSGHSTNEPLAELDQYGSKPNVGAKDHGVIHIAAP